MPNYAGFAAVAQVRDTTVNQIVRIFHSANVIPAAVRQQFSFSNPLGPGTATIAFDAFMDAPQVTLATAAQDRVIVDLRVYGGVEIVTPQLGSLAQTMQRTARVRALPVADLLEDGVHLRLSATDIQIEALDLQATEGPPLPAAITSLIGAPQTRATLGTLAQTLIGTVKPLTTPLFVPLLEQIGLGGAVHLSRLAIRILDGAIAVGVDVRPGTVNLETQGDPAAIVNFLSKSDLALCAHPGLAPLIALYERPTMAAKVAEKDAKLDDFWMRVEGDHFRVGGHVTQKKLGDEFGAAFELSARPKLGTPDHVEHYDEEYGGQYTVVTPGSNNIWIDAYDVDADLEMPWWVYVAAGLSVGVGYIVSPAVAPLVLLGVTSIIDAVRAGTRQDFLHGAEGGSNPSRVTRITLPGTTAPFVDLTVSQLAVSSDKGIQSRLWFTPQAVTAQQLTGPGAIAPEQMLGDPLRYQFEPAPNRYNRNDPAVRVRWQVHRMDTNEVVLSVERAANEPGAFKVQVDLKQGALRQCDRFSISCRVYRWLGALPVELENQTLTLTVVDRLKRNHPYVRWTHKVYAPQVKVAANGTRRLFGYKQLKRRSVLHRTAVPGRCRFADQYSYRVEPEQLEYLDALPFPPSQLAARRHEVCPYCFFGGPNETKPLIPLR